MGVSSGVYLLVVLALVAHVLDWRQTLVIARSEGRWLEINPVLGPLPTVRQVHWWFAISAMALVVFVFVAGYAFMWLAYLVAAAWLVVELWVVRRNHFLGIGV